MNCLFCRIVAGEIPAEIIAETEGALAFLDVMPLADGHVLVIPREHAARVEEMSTDSAAGVFALAASLAGPVRAAFSAAGTTIGVNDGEVTGQTVPHMHIHIVPRFAGDGAGSIHTIFKAHAADPSALPDVGARIRKRL
ncbi:MAG: HIT family protein [bacterium]|jgi:histidine triad (HIT) family protein